MKAVLLILDGLGDRRIPKLRDKTPLEAAHTRNMDYLAKKGITGIIDPVSPGIPPGSDTAHLSFFGIDPKKNYPGRGAFEALGAGLEMKKGDIGFRVNFSKCGKSFVMEDRYAGDYEKNMEKVLGLLKENIKFRGVKFEIKQTVDHRGAVIFRGKGLSKNVSDCDPKKNGLKIKKCRALKKSGKKTARIVNKFMEKSFEILKKKGFKVNVVVFRGAGERPKIPSFEERYGIKSACIAGGALYKGVAKACGMEVIKVVGATGKPDTDFRKKGEEVRRWLNRFDFIFCHVKGTDSASHKGDFYLKRKVIERVDKELLPEIQKAEPDLICITGDHTTPCEIKAHSGDPVPVLFYGKTVRPDRVKYFSEKGCMYGGLGRIRGLDLTPLIMNYIGKEKMFGV